MRTTILGRESITIGAGRAADDPVLVVAGLSSSRLPRPVVGHRTFDGEHTAVVVSDDEEKWFVVGIVSRHQLPRAASDTGVGLIGVMENA
jgi:hypothetical protein